VGFSIFGIVSMVRQSEAETAAVERYQYPQMPMPAPYASARSSMPGHAFKVPLLSLSF